MPRTCLSTAHGPAMAKAAELDEELDRVRALLSRRAKNLAID